MYILHTCIHEEETYLPKIPGGLNYYMYMDIGGGHHAYFDKFQCNWTIVVQSGPLVKSAFLGCKACGQLLT